MAVRRRGAAVLLAVLLVGGLTGCQVSLNGGDGRFDVAIGGPGTQRFTDTTAVTEPLTAVRFDIPAGDVRVQGRAGTVGARIERVVRTRADVAPGPTHRVEAAVLVLSGCGRDCAVDHIVVVAPGTAVTGETSAGGIALTDAGPVEVTTTAGEVTLDGVTGPTAVRTGNGTIDGRRIGAGGVAVESANGDIALVLDAPQDVRGRTGNGDIDLVVAPGAYRVQAETGLGDRRLDVPDDPSAPFGIDLHTANGSITLRPAG